MTPHDDNGLDDAAWETLALSVSPVAPRPGVREKLMARAAAESRPVSDSSASSFTVKPGVTAVRTSTVDWLPSPIPGIEYKLVARDAERGVRTTLLRFAAGARYPPHRHAGTEEIFLLEGTVCVNGIVLSPGDYCRSEPGTEESGTYSETGGLALVISSERDEVDWGAA